MPDKDIEEKPEDTNVKLSKLDWKDYLAFTMAALQTIALPFILIAILLFLFAFFFTNVLR